MDREDAAITNAIRIPEALVITASSRSIRRP